jgi:glycosyltransferase involved in cell wall biosynthesis
VVGVSVVIPAYNEAARIEAVVLAALAYADEVIVVDDGSEDATGQVAAAAGARVIRQANAGYISAVKRGFREAREDVVVTMDADGEHRAEDIPRLAAPILAGQAELVLGARPHITRASERLLNRLARLRVTGVSDTGTGFRALRRELALQLRMEGRCICGVSVLEAAALGARIVELPIELSHIEKPRRVAWYHAAQLFHVLRWLVRSQGLSRVSTGQSKRG